MSGLAICVFCGSNAGNDPAYAAAASELGVLLAKKGLGLVYGGGNNGLMGALADACLAAGGKVHGVITRDLKERGFGHGGLQHMDVVETMHQRKARMNELSSGFVTLPGGVGTLEEFFEVCAWAQLGIHSKPIGILNVKGYYALLLEFLHQSREKGFIPPEQECVSGSDAAGMLEKMLANLKA